MVSALAMIRAIGCRKTGATSRPIRPAVAGVSASSSGPGSPEALTGSINRSIGNSEAVSAAIHGYVYLAKLRLATDLSSASSNSVVSVPVHPARPHMP